MKTSFELPESLLRDAAEEAARAGLPLGEFVALAIQSKLAAAAPAGDAETPAWRKHFGALAHLHEESVHIEQLIAEEFETIDEQAWR
ncbi:MAG TPA: hypothetical protein PKC18_03085 [Lacipirellulaceae bacterium]|nr:hypothetical protein [Lacipirellulaceae bacterium]